MGGLEDFFFKSVLSIQVSLKPEKVTAPLWADLRIFLKNLSKIFIFH